MVHVRDIFHDVSEVAQSILGLPAVLQSIYDNQRERFWELMGTTQESFWNCVDDEDPRLEGLGDARLDESWKRKWFPFVLHGDSGVYAKRSAASLLTVSVKSLLSTQFDENIIPIFVLPNLIRCMFENRDSADEFWEAAIYMLNACFFGYHPQVDFKGNPWPDDSREAQLAGRLCATEKFIS